MALANPTHASSSSDNLLPLLQNSYSCFLTTLIADQTTCLGFLTQALTTY